MLGRIFAEAITAVLIPAATYSVDSAVLLRSVNCVTLEFCAKKHQVRREEGIAVAKDATKHQRTDKGTSA